LTKEEKRIRGVVFWRVPKPPIYRCEWRMEKG